MYYEINVSKLTTTDTSRREPFYRHLFATAPRSATSEDEAKNLYLILRAKFPESEGYNISVSLNRQTGEYLDWSTLTP